MAANAGAIKAGNAFVQFTLSDKKIAGQLRRLQKRFSAIGSSLQRIGAIGIAVGGAITSAFAGAAKVFASVGDTLDKMSKRTGVSVQALSGLEFAASQTGTSFETVEKGFAGLSRTFLDAKLGLSTANDALAELGLNFQDLEGLSPEKQFELVADRISQISDESIRGAVAQKIFGRSGRQLLPLMKLGADGIRAYRQEAEDLGITLTDEDATAAADLTDALDRLWRQMKAVTVQIGAAVAGPLTDFLALTKPIIKSVIDWIKNNVPLLRTIAAIGLAIGAVGGTLVAAGLGFSVLGIAAGGLASAIGVVGTVLAAIVSPIGLVVAAIAGGVTAFTLWTDTGQGMVKSLVDGFGWLKDTVMTSLKAIGQSLAAGDIALAGKVLWSTLQLLWLEGTAGIRETWHSTMGVIVKVWHTAWSGMLSLVNSVWGNLERGWSHTTEFFANTWDSMISGIKRAWNSTIAFLQKTWLRIQGFFGKDVQGEIDRINAQLESANKKIRDDTSASQAQRSGSAAAERERSRQLQQSTLDVIGEELAKKLAGADAGTKERIAAAQKQLEDARSAWKEATEAAQAVTKATESMSEAGNAIADAVAQSPTLSASSRGTFNAVNLLGLQSATRGPLHDTAKNTEQLVKLNKQMLQAFAPNLFQPIFQQG